MLKNRERNRRASTRVGTASSWSGVERGREERRRGQGEHGYDPANCAYLRVLQNVSGPAKAELSTARVSFFSFFLWYGTNDAKLVSKMI